MRRRIASFLALVAVATGLAVAVGSPAQAWGTCWTYGYVWMVGYGDAYRPIPYGNGSDPYNCHMAQGATGDAVKLLQYSINKCYGSQSWYNLLATSSDGFAPTYDLAVDGQFGPTTKRAVQKVQKYVNTMFGANISVDGSYGPQTRAAMSWWTGGTTQPSGKPNCDGLAQTSWPSNTYPVQYDGSSNGYAHISRWLSG